MSVSISVTQTETGYKATFVDPKTGIEYTEEYPVYSPSKAKATLIKDLKSKNVITTK